MIKIKGFIILFLFLLCFWILLTGIKIEEIITGLFVAFIISLILHKNSTLFSDIRLNPKSFWYGIVYLFVFLTELFKSNLDVAFRVLNPSLPINPGIVKVKTKLRSRLGRIILANSITLTPGTLTVETKGEYFYIHWIDVGSDNIETATGQIVSRFEKYLEVIFG